MYEQAQITPPQITKCHLRIVFIAWVSPLKHGQNRCSCERKSLQNAPYRCCLRFRSSYSLNKLPLTFVIGYDNIFISTIIEKVGEELSWDIEYYQKENGEVPVEDFLLSLNPKLRAKAYSDIMLLKRLGINIRAPYSVPLQGDKHKGLFELRTKFSSDITRVFYFLYDKNKFVLLHGFVKKTNKTPERELERAVKYKKDYERRCQDD